MDIIFVDGCIVANVVDGTTSSVDDGEGFVEGGHSSLVSESPVKIKCECSHEY